MLSHVNGVCMCFQLWCWYSHHKRQSSDNGFGERWWSRKGWYLSNALAGCVWPTSSFVRIFCRLTQLLNAGFFATNMSFFRFSMFQFTLSLSTVEICNIEECGQFWFCDFLDLAKLPNLLLHINPQSTLIISLKFWIIFFWKFWQFWFGDITQSAPSHQSLSSR